MSQFSEITTFSKEPKLSGCNLILDTLITHRYAMDPHFIYPYYLNVILTMNCNTRCLFCSSDSSNQRQGCFNCDTVCESIKKEMEQNPPLALGIGGGEPMLYPNECLKILRLCKQDTILYLLTNLNYQLTPAHFSFLDELSTHSMSLIQTSFDTLDEELVQHLRRGTNLKLVQENLHTLKKKYNFPIKVNITVSEYNFREIEQILLFCEKEDIDSVHCNFVLPLGRADRDVTVLSFLKTIHGLNAAVQFAEIHNSFRELTINSPVEVAILQDIFKSESYNGEENFLTDNMSSKQYVCNINVTTMECFAGWEGSKSKVIGSNGFMEAYKQAVLEPDSFRTNNCSQCKFRYVCNKNTAYFNKCILELYGDQIEILLQKGSMFSQRESARNAILDLFNKGTQLHYIDLAVTQVCNGHCNFCQAAGSHIDLQETLSPLIFNKFIGDTDVHVTITGGEPLIKKDLVEEIIKLVKRNPNSTISILTNLSLLCDNLINSFVKHFGYYDVVQVSVYSCNPKTHKLISGRDDWDIINQNISKLVNAGVQVRANLTLTMDNMDDLEETYQFYRDLGVDHICISPLIDTGFATGMVDEEYLLRYVFETSQFANHDHDRYNIAIPINALRGYYNSLAARGVRQTQDAYASTISGEKSGRLKIHIEYNGDIFCKESMKHIGNIQNTSLSQINTLSSNDIGSHIVDVENNLQDSLLLEGAITLSDSSV